ncbi:rhodanese-like domain-containing protein [Desulfobaculum bizertense]|uniref:rhodanese-like domain-containing protein n=1 Tax=Desulfobaculum bizertense TaxID=376490 RepID=UPI001F25BB2A|nr:rhodanese-like domain-containing protein [Desulfobaculum bizertense]UIJ39422.1 rhodanese-like domain-containing protein [Desulfobaculum bizertense]
MTTTKTETFEAILSEMDLSFLGSGQHSISAAQAAPLYGTDKARFIDVRTPEEISYLPLPFATNIPLNTLSEHLDEISDDTLNIVFCTSIFRGAVAYAYLRYKGYENVKCLTSPLENFLAILKPGTILKKVQG